MILKPSQMKKQRKPAVKVLKDGREACNMKSAEGHAEYKRRIQAMWDRQGGRCGLQITPYCKTFKGIMGLPDATFEHQDGRGMNGSRRDDRIEKDGKPYNMAVCLSCNTEKGSRRLETINGR